MLKKLAINLPGLRWSGKTHISLALVGLMWVLPFLYYYHAYPLTTFYQEWGAALLGLFASIILLRKQYWQQPVVPRIVLLPVGLMMLALLQYLLGTIVYFDQALLYTLYMLWLAVLMMLGRALHEQLGLAVIATVLATFLLLGAELNALAGILQHYRWHTILNHVVTAKNSIAVYGNMAQPNHYANYITLGLISLGLLRIHLRSWQVVLLALPLIFVLVLSGSRSSWLYLLSIAVMAYWLQRRDRSIKGLLPYALMLVLGFGLMHWLVQLSWMTGSSGSVTTVERMMSGDTNGSVRLYLWHEAWLMFTQSPLLGAGVGQFAWQHFQLAPMLKATYITGLYNNAHNFLLQIAVEMGLAGLLVVLTGAGMWLWQCTRTKLTIYHWWAYGILAVLSIHAMLEYPMWYAYFLGVAAVLLGALDRSSYRLEMRVMGRVSLALILLMGFLSLVQLQWGYQRLEHSLSMRPKSAVDTTYMQNMRDGLVLVHGTPLLLPYAELFMNNFIEVSADQLDGKLEMNDRAMKFVPINAVVYKRALLLALAGREDEAQVQMERAIWAYPHDYTLQKNELSVLAQKDPAHFSALLKFAIQKNEEYLSAVSTK